MEHQNTLKLRAHAKVNLALSVGPPVRPGRPNAGMHPICSWMHCIELHDEIRITRLEDGKPSAFLIRWADEKPVEWPVSKDLAFCAHKALEAAVGRSLPASIEITKVIPAGGGLGGGSSNAASVMLGLDSLFGLGLGNARLVQLSRSLGSDLAFFLDGDPITPPQPAIVTGLGEQIERLNRHSDQLMLYFPDFGCPTGEVYAAYDHNPTELEEPRVRRIAAEHPIVSGELFNDLTGSACVVHPPLAAMLADAQRLAESPVHLSGSGSTAFRVVAAGDSIEDQTSPQGVRTILTRLV